jgi:hypothetical protein
MRFILLLLVMVAIGGCSLGPSTVQRDRMGYITVISDSLKTQMLFNLVKMRYGDMPLFMDISSIINQYQIGISVNASGSWINSPSSSSATVGGAGQYAERPTITYTPQTGEKFTRSLLTPIPPSVVMNFLQAGKSPETVLRIAVQSINGIQNQGVNTPADPRFERLINLITKTQQLGGVVVKIGEGKDKGTSYLIITKPDDPNAAAPRDEIRDILKLNHDATEFTVVYGASSANDTQIAIVTRSVFDVMVQVSLSAEVPQKDIDEGRSYPNSVLSHEPSYKPLARIHCSKSTPQDAFVVTRYRNLWFWVDDKDMQSKRMFTTLLLMVNLAESGQPAAAPLVTIPAG